MPYPRIRELDGLEMLVVMAEDGSSGWSTEKKADNGIEGCGCAERGFGRACC